MEIFKNEKEFYEHLVTEGKLTPGDSLVEVRMGREFKSPPAHTH